MPLHFHVYTGSACQMLIYTLTMTVCRRLQPTSKVPDTRGCTRCCVGRNPYNAYRYLCGAVPSGIVLMQWYEPLNKFMLLKVRNPHIPFHLANDVGQQQQNFLVSCHSTNSVFSAQTKTFFIPWQREEKKKNAQLRR